MSTDKRPTQTAERCIFTASEYHGRWWLDRVNPDGRTVAAVGPFSDELAALRHANWSNRVNHGWEAVTDAE